MGVLFYLFAGVLVIAIAWAIAQKVVKLAVTAGIVLFLALTAWYLIEDNVPEPVADKMGAAATTVKDAGVKAAGTVGGKAVEVGKEVGAKAATEVKDAAAKAGEKVVDAAAQGVKQGAANAVQTATGQTPPPAAPAPAKK